MDARARHCHALVAKKKVTQKEQMEKELVDGKEEKRKSS